MMLPRKEGVRREALWTLRQDLCIDRGMPVVRGGEGSSRSDDQGFSPPLFPFVVCMIVTIVFTTTRSHGLLYRYAVCLRHAVFS
jgi:hypothetical protein